MIQGTERRTSRRMTTGRKTDSISIRCNINVKLFSNTLKNATKSGPTLRVRCPRTLMSPMAKTNGIKRRVRPFVSCLNGVLTEVLEQEVPLEATLAGPRPKPRQSKFKSERLAQAYGTHMPSTTPSTSHGTSMLPNSSGPLRHAVRMGKLEGSRLVGAGDSDGDGEGEEFDDARVHAFINGLHRGDVTNAGAASNSDALIASLDSAYGGAPPRPPPVSSSSPAVPQPAAAAVAPAR